MKVRNPWEKPIPHGVKQRYRQRYYHLSYQTRTRASLRFNMELSLLLAEATAIVFLPYQKGVLLVGLSREIPGSIRLRRLKTGRIAILSSMRLLRDEIVPPDVTRWFANFLDITPAPRHKERVAEMLGVEEETITRLLWTESP